MIWTIDLQIPPPMRWTKKGLRPAFSIISKNSKISRGRYSSWGNRARNWGEDILQILVGLKLVAAGLDVGDGKYLIKVRLLVSHKHRIDCHNFLEIIADFLQPILQCDDTNFLFKTLATEIVSLEKSGIYLEISRLE